jgi:hypothetical protein
MSLLTLGLEKGRSRLCSSRRLSSVDARKSSRSQQLGIAVIWVEDQRLLAAIADPPAQTSPTHQIGCNSWVFSFSAIPATT